MSEDRLHSALQRASHADALLKDELLIEGFDKLEQGYIELWRSTSPNEERAREKLYLAVNVIGKLREHLKVCIANGKIAKAELEDLVKERERKKFRVFGR